ncbi:capsular polysaccharide transport system permease protein [Aliiroseovarius halocynthiae]|nr:ABC transporter permease [Aliiroseovarius halocynthiae]SMR70627.1 capsular polysaccharide transport system permease protein [Aliiroseovarius halocynthiae]
MSTSKLRDAQSPLSSDFHTVRKRPRFQMLRTVGALMLREMATTYGRSVGGYLWAVLEPIAGIAFLSLIFSMVLTTPGLGTNFPLFYASGFMPFAMTLGTIGKIAQSVRFSRPFMAYPCVTFMDAIIARLLLALLTNLFILAVVLLGIMFIFGLPVWMDLPYIVASTVLGMFLAMGIGSLNCYLMTSIPVYEQLWSIATRPMFLMSGVFFTFDIMPKLAQDILWYNPIIHLVGLMRRGLYPVYHGDYISIPYILLVSAITLFFGLLLLNRHFKTLMES